MTGGEQNEILNNQIGFFVLPFVFFVPLWLVFPMDEPDETPTLGVESEVNELLGLFDPKTASGGRCSDR